jgi:hypothetical protein
VEQEAQEEAGCEERKSTPLFTIPTASKTLRTPLDPQNWQLNPDGFAPIA